MKKRILFVDDEHSLLEGLRNRLRHQRHKWDMKFAGSGREALEVLAREHFDVIVSDLRMPDMDGATLLQRVREAYPSVTRIVLSGHADESAMFRTMAAAHQFLPKPCDPGVLENVVDRACNLQTLIDDERVKQAISKIGSLPSPPAVYSRLIASLADEGNYPQNVARTLKEDGALCAQMLHIVNSAYFGLTRPVINVEEAVIYLGLNTVRQLALVAEVFRQASPKLATRPFPEMTLEAIQSHSLLVARIASALCPTTEMKEAAFVGALLHDVGKVILVSELPDRLHQIISEMRASGDAMCAVESRLSGVTHAEIGAHLLALWQLPFSIVEAVANHHAPQRAQHGKGITIVAAVYIANVLANDQLRPMGAGVKHGDSDLDTNYLESLGVTAKLTGWREMAQQMAKRSGLMGGAQDEASTVC